MNNNEKLVGSAGAGIGITMVLVYLLVLAAIVLAVVTPPLSGGTILASLLIAAAGFLALRVVLFLRNEKRQMAIVEVMHQRQGELNHRPARRASAHVPPSWCWDDVNPTFDCD